MNNQQFKAMTVIASSALLIAVGITFNAVTERILLPSDATLRKSKADSIFAVLRSLLHRTWNLPPRIQAICWCQFWSWIGWFLSCSTALPGSAKPITATNAQLHLQPPRTRKICLTTPLAMWGTCDFLRHHICLIYSPPLRHQVSPKLALGTRPWQIHTSAFSVLVQGHPATVIARW